MRTRQSAIMIKPGQARDARDKAQACICGQ